MKIQRLAAMAPHLERAGFDRWIEEFPADRARQFV
jgi:hypothetical protein